MLNIYLDPAILALPADDVSHSDIESYVNTLLMLWHVHESHLMRLLVSARAIEILEETRRYPFWTRMDTATPVQRKDVSRIVLAILSRSPSLESFSNVDAILIDGAGCTPDEHLADRPKLLVDAYHDIGCYMSLEQQLSQPRTEPAMITRAIVDGGIKIRLWGTLLDVESATLADVIPLGPYEGSFLHASRPGDLLQAIDIGCTAALKPALMEAIRVVAYQQENPQPVGDGWLTALRQFSFNGEFVSSVTQMGFADDPSKMRSLLRAAAYTVLGTHLDATHHLRRDAGADSPQLVRNRDGAKAWRRDIDYEYHLHYWHTTRGPEFASVVSHNDFNIPH